MDGSPTRFLCPWGFSQARRLEWVAISSSRGIFPTQGLNLPLLHGQADSLSLSHPGSHNSRGQGVELSWIATLGLEAASSQTLVPHASLSTP